MKICKRIKRYLGDITQMPHNSFFKFDSNGLKRNKDGRTTILKEKGPWLKWFDHKHITKKWLDAILPRRKK